MINFLRCIGQHFADSGLLDVWVESGVFSECTASNILEGKMWNRAVRAYKLTFEAVWRCLWPEFTKWCEASGHDLHTKITETAEKLVASFKGADAGTARIYVGANVTRH